jgi:hypothetical protein
LHDFAGKLLCMTKKIARPTKRRTKSTAYRVGRGEEGALLVEPYRSELMALWKFRPVDQAMVSAKAIYEKFLRYAEQGDFVGMDMSRKYLLMGQSRTRRYARNQRDVFKRYLEKVESDLNYVRMRAEWKIAHG